MIILFVYFYYVNNYRLFVLLLNVFTIKIIKEISNIVNNLYINKLLTLRKKIKSYLCDGLTYYLVYADIATQEVQFIFCFLIQNVLQTIL